MSDFTTSFAAVSAQVQRIREQKGNTEDQQGVRSAPVPTDQPQKKQRVNAFNNTPKPITTTNTKIPSLQVNKSQTGNPLLQHLTNINWSYVHQSSPFDYLINSRRIVFLSLKYHKLHPEYIQRKLDTVTKGAEGKNSILILVVDVENSDVIMKELSKICIYEGVTMLCAFGFQEAAKWILSLAGIK